MSVEFEVAPTLVEAAFRLPAGYRVVGAHWGSDGRHAPRLVLRVETDGAPEGAVWMSPHYSRVGDQPDPVQVTGMTWFMEDRSTRREEFS